MKCKFIALFVFILLISACAQDTKDVTYVTEQVVVYDSTKTSQPRYYIPPDSVNHGDTLIFVATRVETPVIFFIPRANELFENTNSYQRYEEKVIEGVKFLIIIVNRKTKWVSEKFIIKQDPEQSEEVRFPYGAYLPEKNEWAEGDSSPAIIVRPGS